MPGGHKGTVSTTWFAAGLRFVDLPGHGCGSQDGGCLLVGAWSHDARVIVWIQGLRVAQEDSRGTRPATPLPSQTTKSLFLQPSTDQAIM